MAYEVTATRKRPQNFDELAGQEFVASTLKNALAEGRIAHAYLFSGPRGVGKTSGARILAKALNCQNGSTPEPCGVCNSCQEITRGNALDVFEIDGASNTGVNDIREIKDEVLFAPNSSRFKVYIIDEVHMLSNSAFNALLKTIEEPPPYIVFIFATTEVHKVPATIRSRCQQFNFRLISLEVITDLLRTATAEMGITAEEDALLWIAKEATGSLRDAYTLFDQVVSFSQGNITLEKIHATLGLAGIDRISNLLRVCAQARPKEALELTAEILATGVAVEQCIIDIADYLRILLLYKAGITRQSLLGISPERIPSEILENFSIPQLEHGLGDLLQLYRDIRFSLNQRFELELAVSRLCSLKDWIPQSELVARIEALRNGQAVSPQTVRIQAGSATKPSSESGMRADPAAAASASTSETPRAPVCSVEQLSQGIIQRTRKSELALASILEKAVWKLNDDVLDIIVEKPFLANSVSAKIQIIMAMAAEICGSRIRIIVKTAEQQERRISESSQNDDSDDETVSPAVNKVDMVQKVFRGNVIQGDDI